MSWVNVILAVNDDTWQRLKDNFTLVDPEDLSLGYVQNDLTNAERRKLRGAYRGHWKSPTLGGTVYHAISLYVPAERIGETDQLKYVEYLPNKWPNKFIIIGVWNRDGTQWGTYKVPAQWDISDPWNPVQTVPETIAGTPVYPIPAQALQLMPDDVIYDANGQEISRNTATNFKNVHTLSGWKERNWE